MRALSLFAIMIGLGAPGCGGSPGSTGGSSSGAGSNAGGAGAPTGPSADPERPPPASGCETEERFQVGAGIADITGPVNEISTGYNSPGEAMEGLAMRLYSRAFVIESPCTRQRVVYASVDTLHLYQSVKLGVVKGLRERFGDVYRAENVMITGTHTHAAPTNTSWHALYNAFNGVQGFDELNYDIVVAGIVDSIAQAHERVTPARLTIARGGVADAAHNRSALPTPRTSMLRSTRRTSTIRWSSSRRWRRTARKSAS